jgi:hypothetical protein
MRLALRSEALVCSRLLSAFLGSFSEMSRSLLR